MTLNGQYCAVCIICLSAYIVVGTTTQDVCGYQICEVGTTFCYGNRCRSCRDLDGTNYGCQNDSTWRICFLRCKEKLIQQYETEMEMYNQTFSKRLEEFKQQSLTSNNIMTEIIKCRNIHSSILIADSVLAVLCTALTIALFLVCREFRQMKAESKNDTEDPTPRTGLLSETIAKDDGSDSFKASVTSDETESKSVTCYESQSSSEGDSTRSTSEANLSFTDQGRDLLKESSNIHLSKFVISNSLHEDT